MAAWLQRNGGRAFWTTLFALVAINTYAQVPRVPLAAGGYHTCALTGAGGVVCWGSNSHGQIGDGTTTSRSTPTAVSGLGSGVAAVAAGQYHTCALTTGGAVLCWGFNSSAQLGDGTATSRSTPTAVSGLGSGVAAIAAGGSHTCALTTGGAVLCWGANSRGQVGDGTTNARLSPTAVSGLGSGVAAVTAGLYHTCAVTIGGASLCWGYNSSGQLGDGTGTNRSTPTAVSGLGSGVAAMSAGGFDTCALAVGGSALCWGENNYGQLGDGTTTARSTPMGVSGLGIGVAAVAAGLMHTCALTTSGGVLCWGFNSNGQLGDGTTTIRPTPTAVNGLGNGIAEIATGYYHTCALTAGGGVGCWGSNDDGELGDGTTVNRSTPVAAVTLEPSCILSIAPLSTSPSFAAGSQGVTVSTAPAGCTAGGWTASGDGAWLTVSPENGTGSGSVTVSWTENTSAASRSSSAIIAGVTFLVTQGGVPPVCTSFSINPLSATVAPLAGSQAVTVTGTPPGCAGGDWSASGDGLWLTVLPGSGSGPGAVLVSWPQNTSTAERSSSATIAGQVFSVTQGASGPSASALVLGARHSCLLTTSEGVACWGNNSLGQGGDGTATDRHTPTAVSGLGTGVSGATGGDWHTCAVTVGGAVFCWGDNQRGQLGDGTTTERLTPTAVIGLGGGVLAIAAGSSHTCALTADLGVMCWGDNTYGQLGDGTTTARLTPTAVSGLGSVWAIAAGGYHTCALTTIGAMLCWGDNYYGEIGDGTTTQRRTPVAVSGLGTGVIAAAMALGYTHTCALTTGAAVLCWGDNSYGDLGDGTATERQTPVAVSGLGDGVLAVASGYYHTCALTTVGGVTCWGYNSAGQVGDGTSTDRWTPVAVSGLGSGLAAVAAGGYHTCALTAGDGIACWGYNYDGQLGDGTTTNRPTPTAVVMFEPPCMFSIAPSSVSPSYAAGSQGVAVTAAPAGCMGVGWTASGDGVWLTVSPGSGSGSGSATVSWTQNTTRASRSSSATIADVTFSVNQSGMPEPAVPIDLDGDKRSDVVIFRGSAGAWWINGQSSPVMFGQAGDIPVTADYNGDGKAELAVYRPSTSEWIIQGQTPVVFGQSGDVPAPGDYNGDGQAERAIFRPSTGEWMIDGQPGMTMWGMRGDIPAPADYNGDGITELAVFRPTTGVWYVMGGETLEWGMWGDAPVAADYNGDGKAEIAVYRPSTGWWYVARGPMAQWGTPGDVPVPLDVDGDGVTEFVVYRPTTGFWYALNPVTSATSTFAWGEAGDVPVGQPPQLPLAPVLKTAGDFDHDGAADVTVFRPSTGGWYTLQSTHAYRTVQTVILGQADDIPVPGDYQGAGYQERAVYRPSTGEWLLEDGRTFTLGAAGDVPVPADYDGDGVMDIAVFTPATGLWSILSGASGFTTLTTALWGASGDVPAPGDYDGDGKTDFAVFTPATGQWSIRSSKTGTTLLTVQWGMSGDIPLTGDFDGDGKTDFGVYRPSTGYWYGLFSSAGWSVANFQYAWWGAPGDIPVPGDYNGDGKAEVAVYRPSNGAWYVMDVMTIIGWGEATDVPILTKK